MPYMPGGFFKHDFETLMLYLLNISRRKGNIYIVLIFNEFYVQFIFDMCTLINFFLSYQKTITIDSCLIKCRCISNVFVVKKNCMSNSYTLYVLENRYNLC